MNQLWQPLVTSRLTLRAFRLSDAAAFADYRSDPEVSRYQGWDVPYTGEQAEGLITALAGVDPFEPGEWLQVAIELRSSGALIGDCAYKLEAPHGRQAEVGLTLARAYQNRGYGTEAMRRLIDFLFAEFDLHRVYANCDADNPPAYRALERLGFRREAHFVENLWFKGGWASEYWYGLLRREWEMSRV